MKKRFQDKVVIVTGASSGIGKVSALAFAREGAKVTIAARRVDQGMQTVEEIKGEGGDAFFVRTDVANTQDVVTMVSKTTILRWTCRKSKPEYAIQ